MTKPEKITVVTEISSCPLLKLTCRLSAGNEIMIKQFDEGRFGTLYRFDRSVDESRFPWAKVPFIIKLMHPGDDCRSIADLHAEIARKAGSFTAGWEELLRGMPFWMGKVKSGKDQTIALVSHDLDALGFVQLHRLLEQDLHKYFSLDFRERVKLAASFALSYAILEKLHFLHADINSENLFVNMQTAEVLLIDFDAGVLRLRGNEIPKSPGKPNEFLPLELKSATGADVTKFNEAAELWSVGFMISTLIFGIHPLFFSRICHEALLLNIWPIINGQRSICIPRFPTYCTVQPGRSKKRCETISILSVTTWEIWKGYDRKHSRCSSSLLMKERCILKSVLPQKSG